MKAVIWTIITAVVLFTSSADVWVQDAMALSIGTTTLGTTSTSTSTFTSINGKPTNTNTTTSVTQLANQNDTNNTNNQGSDASTGLGLAAIAAGMAMVAAGIALMANPPTAPAGAALVAAGMMLIAAGMAALAAAGNMSKNANKAANNASKLGPSDVSGPTSTAAGDSTLPNDQGGSSIKIDPALARNGKVAEVLSDFEKKTGLSQDDLINGLNSGKSPMEILSNAPKVGKSEGDLQKMMDKALANNAPLSAQDVMGKLGLTPEDLGAYTQGGGERQPAAAANAAMTDFDSLFGKNNLDAAAAGAMAGAGGALSPEVQAALDRSGITSRTIFEMVHGQYKKKMPMMFGVKKETLDSGIPQSKPLYDLKGTAGLDI